MISARLCFLRACTIQVALFIACLSSAEDFRIVSQTAVAGVSTNINIPCALGREESAVHWIINGSYYGYLGMVVRPLPFLPVVHSQTQLTIPAPGLDLNGTTFQCFVFFRAKGLVKDGTINILLVKPNTSNPGVESSTMSVFPYPLDFYRSGVYRTPHPDTDGSGRGHNNNTEPERFRFTYHEYLGSCPENEAKLQFKAYHQESRVCQIMGLCSEDCRKQGERDLDISDASNELTISFNESDPLNAAFIYIVRNDTAFEPEGGCEINDNSEVLFFYNFRTLNLRRHNISVPVSINQPFCLDLPETELRFNSSITGNEHAMSEMLLATENQPTIWASCPFSVELGSEDTINQVLTSCSDYNDTLQAFAPVYNRSTQQLCLTDRDGQLQRVAFYFLVTTEEAEQGGNECFTAELLAYYRTQPANGESFSVTTAENSPDASTYPATNLATAATAKATTATAKTTVMHTPSSGGGQTRITFMAAALLALAGVVGQ